MCRYRIFIGNPGAGKSTLANCIAMRVLFKSGISNGSGKTYKLDKVEAGGIMYLDTPGLANIKSRKAAASAITEALRQNGKYQIFFAVTLSAGKIRPEDLATIWLVLQSAPDINHFSIVINKLSKVEHNDLKNNNGKSRLLAPLELMGGRNKNITTLLLQRSWMLEDAEDQIEHLPELVEFVRDAPWVDVASSGVNEIPCDDDSFFEKFNSLTVYPMPKPVRLLLLLFFLMLFSLLLCSCTECALRYELRFKLDSSVNRCLVYNYLIFMKL